MKIFKEDSDYYNRKKPYAISLEKFEKTKSENYINSSKDYTSDAPYKNLKSYLHNNNKIIINLQPIPTTSEYSEGTESPTKHKKMHIFKIENEHFKKIEEIYKEKEKKLKELINIEGKYDLNITNCIKIKFIFLSYI